ncbi:MAG: phosphoenolpyruvate--protein phosphotransferase, partial [Treponema sp.]|nr:phosphoenolpyruvate--protein phosphotransferase [Treponema sp.]
MVKLKGKGVSSGIAVGRVFYHKRASHAVVEKKVADRGAELARFHEARIEAGNQLDELSESMMDKIGKDNALLFEVHRMMLEDADFVDPIVALIEGRGACAEWAVMEAGEALARDFSEMEDDYMRERAADIKDVAQRVVNVLRGAKSEIELGDEPAILAGEDFSPSETAALDRSKVLAMVSQAGAANSHTAIFARTMGIPAIIGLGEALSPDFSGKSAALDGDAGILCVEPDEAALKAFTQRKSLLQEKKQLLEIFRGQPTLTKSGRAIKLYANIGSAGDVEAALAGDAEGIGLFRSEFLFLGRSDYPDEDVQYESYRKVAQAMAGRQVIIRTLDIGADKQAKYFELPVEENPALGMRAIRICLTRPEIFKTQLRAIYRASAHGNVAIMFPMISSLWELVEAKK